MVVDGNKSAFIDLQTDCFKVEVFCVWSAPYRYNKLVTFEGMFGSLVVSIVYADSVCGLFCLTDPYSELDMQTLLYATGDLKVPDAPATAASANK